MLGDRHINRATLRRASQRGISLVEVMVAITVWTLSLVAILGLINYSQLNVERAAIIDDLKKFTDKALKYYSEQVSQRQLYVGIKGVVPHDVAIFGQGLDGGYIFTINIKPIDGRIISIEITARGPKSTEYIGRGFVRIKEATIVSTLGVLDDARDMDWCQTSLDIGRLHYVRGVYAFDSDTNITDMVGFADYLVVSTDDTKKIRPDILILRATSTIAEAGSTANLELINSFDTGLGGTTIAVNYPSLYIGTKSASEQLQIYDITNPSVARLVATSTLRTGLATTTPVVRAMSYRAKDKTLHIGTEKWSGQEYNILDLSSSTRPMQVGGLEIGAIVKDIYNTWPYTYISTGAQQQLSLLRTDNPGSVSSASILQSLSPSGWQTQEGSVLRRAGGHLWWGRTVGGFNNVHNHELFNLDVLSMFSTTSLVGMPAGPSYALRGSFGFATSSDVGGSVRDIIAGENHVIALTTVIGKEIIAYGVSEGAGAGGVGAGVGAGTGTSTSIIASKSIPIAGLPVKLWCNGNNIFVALNAPPRVVLLSTK